MSLETAFKNAVSRVTDQRGKPAILGKADGTLYWVSPSGTTYRTRVWARVGEQASNQEVVVDCISVSPQIGLPVRVDHVNGALTVIDVDNKRVIEFTGERPGAKVGAHAWTHSRLGPDPLFLSGLQFLPLLVTPTNPPDLTVTVQAGAYTLDDGSLQFFDTAVSGSLSAYVPVSGHHFVIICLDRPNDTIVIVDGDDIGDGDDALFGEATVSKADIEAVSVSADYLPLAVVLLYVSQTEIRARDITHDLRPNNSAAGSSTPGGSDTQLQYNNDGAFGGIPDVVYDDVTGRLLIGATSPETTAKLEVHPTAAQDARNSFVNTQAVSAANTVGHGYWLKDDNGDLVQFGSIAIGSTTTTPGGEYGVFEVQAMYSGSLTSMLYLDATGGMIFNDSALNMDVTFRGDSLNYLLNLDAGLGAVRIGGSSVGTIADFRSSQISMNPEEADRDFVISGSGVTNGYFYDAGNNRHGFGTGTPERSIHVVGDLIRIDRDGNSPGLITRRTTTGLGANSDISTVNAEALSSASTVRTYGAFGVRITDNTDGAEYALYRYRALVNGTLTDVMAVGTNVGVGTLSPTEKLHVAGNVAPTNNDTWDVGTATFRWDDIYATNGTIQTSDANNKREIRPSDLGLDFILSLEPVKYKFKNGKRDHYGLTGQQLETALNGRDFAGLTIAEGVYGIRYTELIGPMIQAIHDLSAEVKRLGGKG